MTDLIEASAEERTTAPDEAGRLSLAIGDVESDETPIDHYLREQQQLTAVEQFAQRHDADLFPAQAKYYRELIPLERPGPGQQYGFEVDLDSCSGCKACVTACHSLNGLDDDESFRSVGLLVAPGSGGAITGWQQTITTTCHHCVDPKCLSGCPVDAFEKDPVTGIVEHLDDQCIGCSYCTLMCPYEVPRYNKRLGIVRKCDLCSDRLGAGEAPACVQACPTSAISVGVVETEAIAAAAAVVPATGLVPTAPRSSLTAPTTRYRTSSSIPADAIPADHFSVKPAHAHTPLAVMLVLTQVSVGAFVAEMVLRALTEPTHATRARPFDATAALVIGLVALGASTLHLGRPQLAWRAIIGFRHSWLSREIVVFTLFAVSASAYAAAQWAGAPSRWITGLGAVVLATGIAGVACSAMIYAVTGRRWWRLPVTGAKFVLTAAIGGASLTLLATAITAALTGQDGTQLAAARPLLVVVAVATMVKLAGEASLFVHLRDSSFTELRRTALLLTGDLLHLTKTRFASALAGGLVAPALLLVIWSQDRPAVGVSIGATVLMVGLTVTGELAERMTFFSAVSSPRMPGDLT